MEALGPGGDRVSPASSTGSLDFRRLSTRVDSAYSSFSAASGDPEPRTPSPNTEVLPYLDSDYVSVVLGSRSSTRPDAVLRTTRRPGSAAAARTEPQAPQIQGTPGPLSRQATPLLYALAAEAEAAARAAEPPSPPASRAAYRQRLQGAQRRVLRETSFQRKELRMSLPARLRPAVPARPTAAHPRSASLSHPGGEEPAHTRAGALGTAGPGGLTNQQRKWCFSEPGKLDRMGWGSGHVGECLREACSSSGLTMPDTQQLQRGAHVEFKGLEETQPQSTTEMESGPMKLGNVHRPPGRRSSSGEVWSPSRGSEKTMATVQAQGSETPRSLFQVKHSRFLTQKEAAAVCPPEAPHGSPASCEQRVSDACSVSTWLPSLPDNDVFLEETPLDKVPSPPDSHAFQGLPTSVHCASGQQHKNGLSQRAEQTSDPEECPVHESPGTIGADDDWQELNCSVGIFRPTSGSPSGTANGDITTIDPTDPSAVVENKSLKCLHLDALQPSGSGTPRLPQHTSLPWGTSQPGPRPTWPSQHFEELVQELSRLDPSLSDTLASQPSPEPPLGLLDGLIQSTEVWAAMRPACGEAGKEAVGASEAGSHQFNFNQQLPASQKGTNSENSAPNPVPDQTCDQGLPTPDYSIQAKKVELASLLQKMLQDLQVEQERLQGEAAAWTRRKAALEAAVGRACASREQERFSRFMTDLERVLGLLLLLGSRLARVRLALNREGSDGDPEERASLLQRLALLQRQQEDAKELKEHVARRERALREVLGRALSAEDLSSYCKLLADKAAVLAHQRGLDERVRLLQDHLDIIRNDLSHHPLSPRLQIGAAARAAAAALSS